MTYYYVHVGTVGKKIEEVSFNFHFLPKVTLEIHFEQKSVVLLFFPIFLRILFTVPSKIGFMRLIGLFRNYAAGNLRSRDALVEITL